MLNKRRLLKRDRWLVAAIRKEGSKPPDRLSLQQRWKFLTERFPFRLAAAFQVAALLIAVGLGYVGTSLLPSLRPTDPTASFETLWQVHAVFVSLAFAGLAILFQLGSEELASGTSLRVVLFRSTSFLFTLAFCGLSVVQLGIVATWFDTDRALVAEFLFALVASVYLVGAAYHRAARLYLNPVRAGRLAEAELSATLRASQLSNWAVSRANGELRTVLPNLLDSPEGDVAETKLLTTYEPSLLRDVDVNAIKDAVRMVERSHGRAEKIAGSASTVPSASEPPAPPRLRLAYPIGSRLQIGTSLFRLHGQVAEGLDLTRLEHQLRAGVLIEPQR